MSDGSVVGRISSEMQANLGTYDEAGRRHCRRLLRIEELITLSRQAMESEDNHPELLMPFYGFALVLFFAYCYPIARWTIRLERKYAVKL